MNKQMRNPKRKSLELRRRPVLRSDTRRLAGTVSIFNGESSSDGKPSRSGKTPNMALKVCGQMMSSTGRNTREVSQEGNVDSQYFEFYTDILCEILSRLPIEAILRCRSVCKTWNRTTRTRDFINMQMKKSINQPSRFICHILRTQYYQITSYPYMLSLGSPRVCCEKWIFLLDTEEGKVRNMPLNDDFKVNFRILCSYNGLICIAPVGQRGDYASPLLICNPINKECMELPQIDYEDLVLAHQAGLCFESAIQKHIVVRSYRIPAGDNPEFTGFYLWTSGRSSWKSLTHPPCIDDCEIWTTVYWNHAFHWRISKKAGKTGSECILSFDTIRWKFQVILFPENTTKIRDRRLELLVLNDRLTLIELDESMMKLWEVTGNKVGEFSLTARETYDTHIRWGTLFQCSFLSRLTQNENLLKVYYATSTPPKLWSHFAIASKDMSQYRPLNIAGAPPYFETISYTPTLVSVDSVRYPKGGCKDDHDD